MHRIDTADKLVAASMTIVSGTALGSFITQATDVVQLLAAIAALAVAIATARYYWIKGSRERDGS